MAQIIHFGGDPHRRTQQSLPWYVVDQLDQHERTAVEAHLADCAGCRGHLETERELAAQIVNLPLNADAGWAAVQSRLRPRNSPTFLQNLTRALRPMCAPNRMGWLVTGQALVLVAAYVAYAALPQRDAAEYHALSAQPAYDAGNVIAIFRPDISEQQFRMTLIRHRARVVDGPTASGAYVLRVPVGERSATLAELQLSKDVVLAQPIDFRAKAMNAPRLLPTLIVLLLALCALVLDRPVQAQAVPETRQVLVLTRMTAAHFQINSGYGGAYGTTQARRARLHLARRIARANGLTITEDWPMPLIDMSCFVMAVPEGKSIEETVRQLGQERDVVFAEPMHLYTTKSAPPSYDDPLYRAQPVAGAWHLAALHQISTGRGVSVAVIDSGIESTHPDLSGQVAINMNFIAGRPYRPESHGTAVAGVIAAKAENHQGIVGVAPNARLWGLRACWQESANTVCNTVSLAKALHYAVEHKAQVTNMSWTGPRAELIDRLLDTALAHRITIVAAYDPAAPNGGFPASHRGVIAVAEDTKHSPRPGIYTAPGRDVITTQLGGKWNLTNGNSLAAAHVSGLFALMRARIASGDGALTLVALQTNGAIDACATLLRTAGPCNCDCAKAVDVAARTRR